MKPCKRLSDLIEDPADPSEDEIIVLAVLGEYVSSKRGRSNPSDKKTSKVEERGHMLPEPNRLGNKFENI